jgi:hypothetical protein
MFFAGVSPSRRIQAAARLRPSNSQCAQMSFADGVHNSSVSGEAVHTGAVENPIGSQIGSTRSRRVNAITLSAREADDSDLV